MKDMAKLFSGCVLLVLSVSQAADVVTFRKLDGHECIEATLDFTDEEQKHARSFLEASLASEQMQPGSCSSSGFTTTDGESMHLQVPFLSKPLRLTRMRMSSWTAAKLKAEAFLASFVVPFTSSPALRNSQRQVVRAPKPLAALGSDLDAKIDKLANEAKGLIDKKVDDTAGAAPAGSGDGAAPSAGVDELIKDLNDKAAKLTEEIKAECKQTGRRLDSSLDAKIDKLANEAKGLIDKKVDDTAGAAPAGSGDGAAPSAGVEELVKDLSDQAAKLTEEIKAECKKR